MIPETNEYAERPYRAWWWDHEDPILADFRNMAYLVWEHLALPPPTPAQYDITYFLQHGWAGYGVYLDAEGTGARYNELARITWSQVDMETGWINLYRIKTDNESKLLNTRRVKAIMARRWAMQGGRYNYVFPALRGRNWAGIDTPRGHATAGIQGVLDKMGLNDDETVGRITPHSFRDTFASWLVQAGVSLLKVSKLLGHADVKMTEKYAHLDPGATGREAMEVLDRLAGMKVAEGEDPKPKPFSHSFSHTEVTHSQQLASRFAEKNRQVLAANDDFGDSLVGRTGFEPVTNGLKVRCSTN